MIGNRIDHYEVMGTLGEGGMGAVYRARDTLLERDVALKFLRPELASQPELVERFRAEAVTLARLNHPNIATLYGMARHGSDLFMVMEYVPGETVEAVVRRSGRLDPFRAVHVGAEVLLALEYAHRAGVIHRDIKPANLILAPGDVIKVTDFGIARVFGAAHQTRLGYIVGTLAYMAPEQIMPERFGGQEADGRADLYALGIVLYEMLTGRVPFDAQSDYALMRAQVEEPPAPPGLLAAVPDALEEVILRALAKVPADRFTSATEFRAALLGAEKAIGEQLPKSTRLTSPVPETRWASPSPSSGAQGATPAPRDASTAPVRPAHAARASTPAGAVRPPAKNGMNWRHYTSLAALGVIVVSLIGAYALRAPRPPQADSLAPVPPVPVARTAPTTAAMPIVPPEAPGRPERVVRPPEAPAAVKPVPAPDRPPASRRPARPAADPPPATPAERAAEPPGPDAPPPRKEAAAVEPTDQAAVSVAPAPEPPKPDAAGVSGEAATPAPPLTFDKVKLVLAEGKKTRELDARLMLELDRVAIVDEDRGSVLKQFSYASIRGAVYSQSKHPRWKTGLGATAAVGVFAAPLFFLKGTKHWFTLQTDDDFAVLQLDKNNYRVILPAFETRSRIAVERPPAEK